MSKRLLALLAAVAAVGLVAAGCGGGSDSTGEAGGTIAKAEFLKQGNAICAKGNEEIEEGFENFAKEHNISEKKPPSEAELKEVAEEVLLPTVQKQLKEIRALGLPEGAEQEAEKTFTAVEAGIKELEANPSVLSEESNEPFGKANKLSRELGLTKCGEE